MRSSSSNNSSGSSSSNSNSSSDVVTHTFTHTQTHVHTFKHTDVYGVRRLSYPCFTPPSGRPVGLQSDVSCTCEGAVHLALTNIFRLSVQVSLSWAELLSGSYNLSQLWIKLHQKSPRCSRRELKGDGLKDHTLEPEFVCAPISQDIWCEGRCPNWGLQSFPKES